MKSQKPWLLLCIVAAFMLLNVFRVSAQTDIVYASNINTDVIQRANVNSQTGVAGTFSTAVNIQRSTAALAQYGSYLYYLNYGMIGEGSGNGRVNIRSVNINGTDHQSEGTYDVNGSSNSDVGFVRFAIDKDGFGWILAKNLYNNTMHIARFQANSTGGVSNFTVISNNITTSDNSNSMFENGDIAFTADGTMFALANSGTTTKLYTIDPRSSTVLQYKWTLKRANGTDFTGSVNGAAFASSGSMYFSASDGLYFLDQNTTNFSGTGTVRVTLVRAQTGLSDLATNYWPEETKLPVRFKNLNSRVIYTYIPNGVYSVGNAH